VARIPDSSLAAPAGRLSYLDWLRFLVVLSLAPFHAALSFTGMGVAYVYDTPIRDLFLSGVYPQDAGPSAMRIFTVFLDNWFMHLLFLVSGIAAAASLRKRTAGQFASPGCGHYLSEGSREAFSLSTLTSSRASAPVPRAAGTSTTASSGSCCICSSSPCWRCR
jgi:hypothetical protein